MREIVAAVIPALASSDRRAIPCSRSRARARSCWDSWAMSCHLEICKGLGGYCGLRCRLRKVSPVQAKQWADAAGDSAHALQRFARVHRRVNAFGPQQDCSATFPLLGRANGQCTIILMQLTISPLSHRLAGSVSRCRDQNKCSWIEGRSNVGVRILIGICFCFSRA